MKQIEVSLLGCDVNEIKQLEKQIENKVHGWHIDVMDGYFTSTVSQFTPDLLKELDLNKPLHIHFMTQRPDIYFEYYNSINNIDKVTYHFESDYFNDVGLLEKIYFHNKLRKNGIKVGLAINPLTKLCDIDDIIKYYDFILIMSVNPGKGGQKFIQQTKIKLQKLLKYYNKTVIVDGGIDENILKQINSMIDIAVIGSYITTYPENINKITSIE